MCQTLLTMFSMVNRTKTNLFHGTDDLAEKFDNKQENIGNKILDSDNIKKKIIRIKCHSVIGGHDRQWQHQMAWGMKNSLRRNIRFQSRMKRRK